MYFFKKNKINSSLRILWYSLWIIGNKIRFGNCWPKAIWFCVTAQLGEWHGTLMYMHNNLLPQNDTYTLQHVSAITPEATAAAFVYLLEHREPKEQIHHCLLQWPLSRLWKVHKLPGIQYSEAYYFWIWKFHPIVMSPQATACMTNPTLPLLTCQGNRNWAWQEWWFLFVLLQDAVCFLHPLRCNWQMFVTSISNPDLATNTYFF